MTATGEIDLLVSDGISGGKQWGTYRRKPSGSLKRIVSPSLPLRPTRAEAEKDLREYVGRKVYLACPAEGRPYDALYDRLWAEKEAKEDTTVTDAMDPATYSARKVGRIMTLPTDCITPSAANPRRSCDAAALAELAESIKTHGLIEPLVVRTHPILGGYTLVAGERRWRACRMAGVGEVRCIVHDGMTDGEALEIMLIENLQREDLGPIEEASGFKALREAGLKEREIAERVHKSQPAVANRLRLLGLPDDVQERIRNGELTPAHGVALARWSDYPAIASKIAELAHTHGWTTRQLEDKLPFWWELQQAKLLAQLDFRTAFDWQKVCPKCPHYRSEYGGQGYCLQPSDFEAKQAEARSASDSALAAKLEEAKASGADLVTLKSLNYEGYNRISYGNQPPGCKLTECPCYLEALDWDGSRAPVCTDVKCWRRLETAKTRATVKATKADVADKLKRAIPEAVARIAMATEIDYVPPVGDPVMRPAEIGSRELAVLAFYALREVGGDAPELVLPGYGAGELSIHPQKALAALAALPPAALVARTVEAILRAEQAGRLKEYSNIGTHASEFFLGDPAKEPD